MFAYTKFKIASKFLATPQIKCFSADSQNNGSTANGNEPKKLNSQDQVTHKTNSNNFICGANATYMEYLFSKWIKNPNLVHKSWQRYFRDLIMSSDNALKELATKMNLTDGKTTDKSDSKDIRLFDNVDITITPKSIKEHLEKKENGNNTTESAGAGISGRMPFQESDCVLGQITFNPKEEKKSKMAIDEYMSVKKLMEDIPKPTQTPSSTKYKTSFDNNMTEHLKTMVKVKAALDKEPCSSHREYIKKKLELIAQKKMQKSLKQLKEGSKVVTKHFKPVEMPKK